MAMINAWRTYYTYVQDNYPELGVLGVILPTSNWFTKKWPGKREQFRKDIHEKTGTKEERKVKSMKKTKGRNEKKEAKAAVERKLVEDERNANATKIRELEAQIEQMRAKREPDAIVVEECRQSETFD